MKPTTCVKFTFLFLFPLLTTIPASSLASSTVIGSTNAMKCYERSQSIFSSDSANAILFCRDAILKDGLSKRDLAATYSNRGIIYARNRDLDKAIKDHNKAIELMPDLAEAYINRGNAYYRLGDYDQAMVDYEKAVELGRGPIYVALHNIGLIFIKLKDINKAREAFLKALEIAPWSTMIKRRLELIEGGN